MPTTPSIPCRAARGAAILLTLLAAPPAPAAEAENVALGKPYTLEPAPNYSGATSKTGATILTDGQISRAGTLWAQPSAAGWARTSPVTITIDLGTPVAIDRVTWHTAAGAADVQWPASIYVFGSVDGSHFTLLGDLVALDAARGGSPPLGHYADYTFSASLPATEVRYLRLMADARLPYLFVDEIQAFRAAGAARRASSFDVGDTKAEFWNAHAAVKGGDAIHADLARLRARIAALSLSADQRQRFDAAAVRAAGSAIESARSARPARSSLPLVSGHGALFAVLGAAEQASGAPPLQAWPANPWSPLQPEDVPHGATPAHLDILAMRGEQRSGAFNVHNGTGEDATVTLAAAVDGVSADQLSLSPVAWTGMEPATWLAAKILPATTAMTIPAGTTQQVWVKLTAGETAPGLHSGAIRIQARGQSAVTVPVAVRIFSTRPPTPQTLVVGGWDYLQDPGTNGVTSANVDLIAPFLRAQGVNTPWATRVALELGKYDESGHLSAPPSTAALGHWLARWPTAMRYRVFIGAGNDLGGIAATDPRFAVAVKEWATFWAAAIKRLGKTPQDFDLHIVDEPRNAAQAQTEIAWVRAIKAAGAGFHVWVNPNWPDPASTPRELIDLVDVVCINLAIADTAGENYWRWARGLAESGKTLEVYGTDGPARQLDPYAYYRAAFWRASAIGASGVSFWSFSDNGGGESSNGFATRSIDYVPYFLDRGSLAPGKQMEAISEGLRDFDYLRLLSLVARKSPKPDVRDAAKQLLEQARTAVLASAGTFNGPWTATRDRSVADAWRLRIGTFLDGVDLSSLH